MEPVTDSLESVWHEHSYPSSYTFVTQWEQEPRIYFRILRSGNTLLVQGLCLLTSHTRGGQTQIDLKGQHPTLPEIDKTIREAVAMIVYKFKEKASQDGN